MSAYSSHKVSSDNSDDSDCEEVRPSPAPSSSGKIDANVQILLIPPSGEEWRLLELEDKPFAAELPKPSIIAIPKKYRPYAKYIKIFIFVGVWVACSATLMIKNVKVQEDHQLSIPTGGGKSYLITELPDKEKISVRLEGALLPPYYSNLSSHTMYVWLEFIITMDPIKTTRRVKHSNIVLIQNISEPWKVPLVSENLIGVVPEVKQKHDFHLQNFTFDSCLNCAVRIRMKTNLKANLPVALVYDVQPINMDDGIVYAAVLLIGLYFVIIFEIIHKTAAAMLASTMSIAILAALNARPTLNEIVSWIDIETLLLLFSMMTMVTIFSETGIFDYTAVKAFKYTGGKEWPLINVLCFLTAGLSCFLDNVTTALLMTPITIRLCEVMKLDPVPILICMIIYSNIGGAITPIGDPPNVIIASNGDVMDSGVNFIVFTVHMGIGVIFASILVHLQLRYLYRNSKDLRYTEPPEVHALRREIAVWQRATACMSSYSKDEETVKETLKKKTTKLQGKLHSKASACNSPSADYQSTVEELEKKYPIRDKVLLAMSTVTMLFVILVFCLHSFPEFNRLGLGWTALLGVLLLLLLSDREDIESIFARVEWSTLLFFASLFILMEALARMGLINWIGKQTQYVVMSVNQESRLAVAILLILWVSAFASAFVDNIPLTTMMIRIATVLADDEELKLPLQPLVWALAFGACFGGNGTLFGSSSNIVCAGVAEQHGYRFSFIQFMKVGFPVMVTSLLVATIYLMLAHVVFQWH